MKKRLISGILCTMMAVGMIMPVSAEEANTDFAGEELSILVSQGWMDNRYDETIARFEETYDVTVDLQTIPALSTAICCRTDWPQIPAQMFSGFSPIRLPFLL